MKKKCSFILAAGFVFLSLLAGCGSDKSGSGGSPSGASGGIAVDPYIEGAYFQEIATDGTVLQETTAPSDSEGKFSFSGVLTPGSTVRMKIGSRGKHHGVAYRGLLSRKISEGDPDMVVVSPLTTLIASGLSPQQVLLILQEAGITGLTESDLMNNPMARIFGLGAQVSEADLELLQANMAVNTFIEKILDESSNQGGFNFESFDERLAGIDATDLDLLHLLVSSSREVLSPANLTEGTFQSMNEMIGESVDIHRDIAALIGQHRNDSPEAMEESIRTVVQQRLAEARSAPATDPNGPGLYADYCAGCHGALASSTKAGRSAAEIQGAIDSVGAMSFIALTDGEAQAISHALATTSAPTPSPDQDLVPDGEALYAASCAGCHGALAGSAKAGRSAAEIQGAIEGVGAMSFITLTDEEAQAISDALATTSAPVPGPDQDLSSDGAALYASTCAGCHGVLASSVKAGRTADQILTAIDSNMGGMGFITLTNEEIQAVADALPAGSGGPDYSDCTACHGQPPSGSTFPNEAGAHGVHAALPGVGTNCSICHTGAAHNGEVDLNFLPAYNAKSGAALDNMDGTCSNVSCHGGQQTPDWWSGSIDVDTQCSSCHQRGTTEYNSFNSGEHRRHVEEERFACTVCHNTDKMGNHFDNLGTAAFETSPADTVGGGSTRVGSYSGGSCSSVQCHGSERW